MTDLFYPNFDYLNVITAAYVRNLFKPYHDALIPVKSIDELIVWIRRILNNEPEHVDNLIDSIRASNNINFAKSEFLVTLRDLTIDPDEWDDTVTPWEYSSDHNEIAQRLFGPDNDKIPVTVVVNNNSYIHELTQELTYGILVALNKSPGIKIEISGVEINQEDLDDEYNPKLPANIHHNSYMAEINHNKNVIFKSPDFVQGVITAAQWINRNPHDIITHLIQTSPNGVDIDLNF